MSAVGIRWTVGDVSSRGWEALRLSIYCAVRLFRGDARFVVCVNSVSMAEARKRTGPVPPEVEWRCVTAAEIPSVLVEHLNPEMAEGVGWKLAPLQVFADRHEIALDNDCLLWAMPVALQAFLGRQDATLLAEDIERCLGQFDDTDVPGAINSGIRSLPPGFDLGHALAEALAERQTRTGSPVLLRSELDEQGLQAAALHRRSPCLVVSREEVSICSPFWPRQMELGSCGAHFVGLNAKHIPWNYFDRSGDHVRREHWDLLRPVLYRKAGLAFTPPLPLDEA